MGDALTYSFENVLAWQKAHAFVLLTYRVTRHFPEDEKFGLTSQFRRAAVSIEANIAEGYKKLSKADKLRFFNISQGSLEECRDIVDCPLISFIQVYDYCPLTSLTSSNFFNSLYE